MRLFLESASTNIPDLCRVLGVVPDVCTDDRYLSVRSRTYCITNYLLFRIEA